jgi:hypothetical protein
LATPSSSISAGSIISTTLQSNIDGVTAAIDNVVSTISNASQRRRALTWIATLPKPEISIESFRSPSLVMIPLVYLHHTRQIQQLDMVMTIIIRLLDIGAPPSINLPQSYRSLYGPSSTSLWHILILLCTPRMSFIQFQSLSLVKWLCDHGIPFDEPFDTLLISHGLQRRVLDFVFDSKLGATQSLVTWLCSNGCNPYELDQPWSLDYQRDREQPSQRGWLLYATKQLVPQICSWHTEISKGQRCDYLGAGGEWTTGFVLDVQYTTPGVPPPANTRSRSEVYDNDCNVEVKVRPAGWSDPKWCSWQAVRASTLAPYGSHSLSHPTLTLRGRSPYHRSLWLANASIDQFDSLQVPYKDGEGTIESWRQMIHVAMVDGHVQWQRKYKHWFDIIESETNLIKPLIQFIWDYNDTFILSLHPLA